jgi:hypothetical protein
MPHRLQKIDWHTGTGIKRRIKEEERANSKNEAERKEPRCRKREEDFSFLLMD